MHPLSSRPGAIEIESHIFDTFLILCPSRDSMRFFFNSGGPRNGTADTYAYARKNFTRGVLADLT
jgi:hypothetical protein